MSVERGASTARRAMGEGRRASGAALPLLGLALVTSGGTALLLLLHHRVVAGVLALVGAASLLFGSAVARASGQRRELLAELLADRVFDASVLAPVAWVTRSASPRIAVLALVALGASFVASYERARGTALGYRGSEGLVYRAVRDALLVTGLITGWLEATLWAFAVVSVAAAAARAWNIRLQDDRSCRGDRVGRVPPGTI